MDAKRSQQVLAKPVFNTTVSRKSGRDICTAMKHMLILEFIDFPRVVRDGYYDLVFIQ
jgi:hypothetical protein